MMFCNWKYCDCSWLRSLIGLCQGEEPKLDKDLTRKEIRQCKEAFDEMIVDFKPLMPKRPAEDWAEFERRLNKLCEMAYRSATAD